MVVITKEMHIYGITFSSAE